MVAVNLRAGANQVSLTSMTSTSSVMITPSEAIG
jgi:hypothetical protein